MAFVLKTIGKKKFNKIFCGAFFNFKKIFCLWHPELIFFQNKMALLFDKP
jgi:hypothetical protein